MRIFPTLFKTGRHEARRARQAADEERRIAQQERAAFEDKKKKERSRANQIKIRALRSRRSSSFYQEGEGRATIG